MDYGGNIFLGGSKFVAPLETIDFVGELHCPLIVINEFRALI